MNKQERLIYKVKRLLRRLGAPRWLHKYGPKKYELLHHVQALLVKAYSRLSYRRTKTFFNMLGMRCPSKSSLQRTSAKLAGFWQRILKATCPNSYIVAMDATGFSRTNPSYHYLRRIDGKIPRIYIKMNAVFDTRKKKFLAAKVRVRPAHDVKDAKQLIKNIDAKIAVADKGYTSEELHEQAYNQGTLLMVPLRKNIRRGFYRKKHSKQFRTRTYYRRELIEAGFGALKRTLGASVSSRKARTIRSELLCRLACYNIFLFLSRLSGQSLAEKATF